MIKNEDTVIITASPEALADYDPNNRLDSFAGRQGVVVEQAMCARVTFPPAEGKQRGRTTWLPVAFLGSVTQMELKRKIDEARAFLEEQGYEVH